MEEYRLQKYLARCGVASRRGSETVIFSGRVAVNGKITRDPAVKVTVNDVVTVDGRAVSPEETKVYIMMNKPKGVISASKDDRDRRCVVDLCQDAGERLFPVGRLDYDTQGLILLTNDGDFMQRLTHPSFEVWRTYEAVVKGVPDEKKLEKLRSGVKLEDGMTLPANVEIIGRKNENAIVEIVLREGRNRQVRRMLEAVGHPVKTLKRVRYGGLELGDLKGGQWRFLKKKDFIMLFGEENAKKYGYI